MKKLFKSFLIVLLCAVGASQAAAQAYPFEKEVTEDVILLYMKETVKLNANSPDVNLGVLSSPDGGKTSASLYLSKVVANTDETSYVVNELCRIASQFPEKGGQKDGLVLSLTLASGERCVFSNGTILVGEIDQNLNSMTFSSGHHVSGRIGVFIDMATLKTGSSDLLQNRNQAISKIANSNIVKLEIGGETFTFSGLRSADTFREMFKALGQQLGRSYDFSTSGNAGNGNAGLTAEGRAAVAVDLGLPSGTKWADRNVGASSPTGYGNDYVWDKTIVCNKWGGAWKMPTKEQCDELIDKCTYQYITINGVPGCKFFGLNGNSIFLPVCGSSNSGDYWTSTSYEYNHDAIYLFNFTVPDFFSTKRFYNPAFSSMQEYN